MSDGPVSDGALSDRSAPPGSARPGSEARSPDGPGHVWVDGRVLPADGPHLSVYDRGFQLGDRKSVV